MFHNKEGSGLNVYYISKTPTNSETKTTTTKDNSKIPYLTPTYNYTYKTFKVAYPQVGTSSSNTPKNMASKLDVSSGVLSLNDKNACQLKDIDGNAVCEKDFLN